MRLDQVRVWTLVCLLCFEAFWVIEGRIVERNERQIVKSRGGQRVNALSGKPLAIHMNIKAPANGVYNVMKYGATANGKTDDSEAFASAWKAACASTGKPTVLIPKGKYLIGPIKFVGPCKGITSITVQIEGVLMASSDMSKYGRSPDWLEFGWVNGLTVTGGGTLDGQGAKSWHLNKCPTNKNCKVLPANVMFLNANNTRVEGITSLNSKFFHIILLDCHNFLARGLKIIAPEDSPNTDGIHIEESTGVSIYHSTIGTGDDCISVGQGNSQITLSGITCGPGHGISVGSLGRYPDEGDVKGLIVRDSTLTGTMNGVRIKTWENSPVTTTVSNMTFENIVMKNVGNPIIIDQTYCPFASCSSQRPSRVKLSDIFFKNIRGTTSSAVAVTLDCSQGFPCHNVNLQDVRLQLAAGTRAKTIQSMCKNVKAKYTGAQLPPPCTA